MIKKVIIVIHIGNPSKASKGSAKHKLEQYSEVSSMTKQNEAKQLSCVM